MPNVVAFPGVTLDPNLDGTNGFKPSEITLCLCAHLSWCIVEKTNPAYGQLKAGLSDEGDGFLYATYLVRRTSEWIDTSPLVHFEKSSWGVKGKFYMSRDTDLNAEYSACDRTPWHSCLQELIKHRQPEHAWTVTKVLFDRHVPSAHRIADEIERYPERIITIDGSLENSLRSLDYKFIDEVKNLVQDTANQRIIEKVGSQYG